MRIAAGTGSTTAEICLGGPVGSKRIDREGLRETHSKMTPPQRGAANPQGRQISAQKVGLTLNMAKGPSSRRKEKSNDNDGGSRTALAQLTNRVEEGEVSKGDSLGKGSGGLGPLENMKGLRLSKEGGKIMNRLNRKNSKLLNASQNRKKGGIRPDPHSIRLIRIRECSTSEGRSGK